MTRFEVGENRAPAFGVPVWAGEWPILVDGTEVAVIEETERGYRLRVPQKGGLPDDVDQERPCRSSVEGEARERFGAVGK